MQRATFLDEVEAVDRGDRSIGKHLADDAERAVVVAAFLAFAGATTAPSALASRAERAASAARSMGWTASRSA